MGVAAVGIAAGLVRKPVDGRLRRPSSLLAAMVLALLVACSSEPDQPGTLPPETPTASSSSASPTPATQEQEVEAAVRDYYAELTRAAQTNDTSFLKTMSTEGCPCNRPVRVIEKNGRKGRSAPDASFQVASVRVHDLEDRLALAEVRTVEAAYRVFGADNQVVGRVPARKHFLDLTLVKNDAGRWLINNEFNLGGNQ